MDYLTAFFAALRSLGGLLKNVLLGLLFVRKGEDKEIIKQQKKELKDAKEAGKRKSRIKSLSDDDLRNGL